MEKMVEMEIFVNLFYNCNNEMISKYNVCYVIVCFFFFQFLFLDIDLFL